ncbi:MAG TPA: translocation/assembly module TamB domain-containing protein [Steroidobacteraceae bacterium]
MRRALRVALIIIAVPILLCVLLWVGLLTIGNTAWGRQQIETLVARLTRNDVRLTGLGGDLPDRPTLRQLQLADSHGVWLQAQNIQATWHPWLLLERRVAVVSAHAERIDWSRLPVSRSHRSGHTRIPDIDVHEASADAVHLSAALAAAPATLNLHASVHLRTLEDMQLAFAATRLDGPGSYTVQWAFNRKRMDAEFNVREPDHGPLAGLLGVAAIGAMQVSGTLNGLRRSEHIDLQARVGGLHATATGTVDLVQRSADLEYAADASAMAPRPDLSWQRLHLRGNWHGPLATVAASGELQVAALVVPGGVRIGALNASLEARGGNLSARATVENSTAPGVPPDLLAGAPLTVNGSIKLQVPTRPFELQLSHPAMTLRAKGQLAGPLSVVADLDVGDVAKLMQSMPAGLKGSLRAHATAQLAGSRVAVRLSASGNLDSTLAAVHPWFRGVETADIRGSYAPGEIRLDQLTAANQALNVALSGRMSAPKRQGAPWSLSGKAKGAFADLSLLLPALSGQANVQADLNGTSAALRVTGTVQSTVAVHDSAPGTVTGSFTAAGLPHAPEAQLQLQGALAGQPLTLQAALQVHPGQDVHIRLPQAEWQSLHAQGDLTLTQDLDQSHGQIKWAISNLADLNILLGQHLAGSLVGNLNMVADNAAGANDSHAQTNLQIKTENLTIGSLKVSGALTGTGPLHALKLSLAAQSPVLGTPSHLAAEALVDAGKRDLDLTALTGQVHGVEVKLLQPARFDFANGLSVSGLRAGLADATLTASGQILPQLQLQSDLTDATPGLIDAILPGYLGSGSLTIGMQLQGSPAHPLGRLELTGKDLRATGDASSLPPAQLSANAQITADGARIALRSSAGESSHLSVEGTIPWNGTIAVQATGHIDLTRLNPLLESAGRRINGTLEVNAEVAGTLDTPSVKGTVQLHKGAIHDYGHGVDLTEIEGTLEGTQKELKITQLSAHAATGTITVSGTLGILQGGWPLDLKFTARNAQPLSSSIVSGVVNADLTLQGTALHQLMLAGTIDLARATVDIPNNFPPNVAVLNVHRPGEQVVAPSSHGPQIDLKVSINAPRQILVRGRGLDAELGGKIQIGGTARAPTVDGGFDLLRGQFTLAGSRLTFSSGRVGFAGSDVTGKIDPTLDFTAQTTTLDTTVTLRITGVADAPRFDLTSVPPLPQDEILARLLFGENAGQLTALQAAQLGAALVTLTGVGTGTNPLAQVQKHLGLDRLSVGSTDTGLPGSTQNNGATIEAGRYVTSRIFVDLKQETTGATQLGVAFDLTSKLKLQTQIGTGTATVQGTTPDNDPGSSIGLSYRFEY